MSHIENDIMYENEMEAIVKLVKLIHYFVEKCYLRYKNSTNIQISNEINIL